MTGAAGYRGWRGLRNRLLSRPGFQRWAARFPLTRGVANRQARALFDVCAGFVYSQVLLACVRVGMIDALADAPQTTIALSERFGLTEEAAQRLLKAAVSLGLVERVGADRWGLGMLGAAMRGNPSIAAFVEHHALFYDDLKDPVALLRAEKPDTRLGDFWAYASAAQAADASSDLVADYSALMAASQEMIASDVLDSYNLGRHQCLLDIGGGKGAFVSHAATRFADLRFKLFDLPAVAEQAAVQFDEAGLAHRTETYGGSFFDDSLPTGADAASLVRVLHDHNDDAALAILKAAHLALPPGGTLIVAEPMSGVKGAEPIGDAYFGFYLLAMGSGRPRTEAENRSLMEQAGFVDIVAVRTSRPMLTGLITGRVAAA